MVASGLGDAAREWKAILGEDHVLTDGASLQRYTNNLSGLKRDVPAVLRPSTTEEVRRIVKVANTYRAPLYPISCGKNWGLGSALPVRSGTSILDLSRMNQVREINVPYHYAVVEPGVTQGQLYQALQERRLPLMINVTGAGVNTSLIGNALERGIGYFANRADALSGLEVVLGNGQVVKTGFGRYAAAATTHLYRHGIGPSLDGLFAQSGFGIVTSAGVELISQRGEHMACLASIDDDAKLGAFIDRLAELRRRGIFETVVHVGNRARAEATLGPLIYENLLTQGYAPGAALRERVVDYIRKERFGPWSAIVGVVGEKGELRRIMGEMKRELKGVATTRVLTDRRLNQAKRLSGVLSRWSVFQRKRALLHATEPLYGLCKGVPSDEPLKSLQWAIGELPPYDRVDPDESDSGMLYCVPMLPLEGGAARETVNLTEQFFAKHGFSPHITLNIIDTRALEAVISLIFDRREARQVEQAHACVEQLQAQLIARGFIPYRVGIQSMHQIVDETDPYWRTVRDLKTVLDPHNVISPGRYQLI